MRTWLFLSLLTASLLTGSARAAEMPVQAAIQSLPAADQPALEQFYGRHRYGPVWSAGAEKKLRAAIARAAEDGLEPEDYRIAADAGDVLLTKAALDYIVALRSGRPALKNLDNDVSLPAEAFDPAEALDTVLSSPDVSAALAGEAPTDPGYTALKAALGRYRALAAAGGWTILPTRPAEYFLAGPGAQQLRIRLAAEDPQSAQAPLLESVRGFQARHGLAADGVVGAQTLAELNVPVAARIQQIEANMERWRWLPRTLEKDRIAINVPDQSLTLVLSGSEVLFSPVVVGRPSDPTPILRAEGAGITVNPPWTVPNSIARKEILPKLKRNRFYLRDQDMVLLNGPAGDPYGLSINWGAIPAGGFPYRIRQRPGAKNPLGFIKIELPNRFEVYLHDTPGKAAFAKTGRAQSHGCVRVEQILPLASYALARDLSAVEAISRAIESGATQYLPLRRKLPVYFLYWTSFAAADGTLQFRPDLYGRDRRMIEAGRNVRTAATQGGCRKA